MSRLRSTVSALAVALLGSGIAEAAPRRPLRPVAADPATVSALPDAIDGRCRELLQAELRRGRRLEDLCAEERALAVRAAVRTRDTFGYVERRRVELATLRLTLGQARRCRRWPLRRPDQDVLLRPDVADAGCRLRRYHGELPLVFVDREGGRHQPLAPLWADRDGYVTIHFAALDRSLRATGFGSLDDYVRIELGSAAWAGRVDLVQLQRFRADWHFNWVARGRGIPGLFAIRHPAHAGASRARAMAAEAQLTRQRRDYERVRRGELSARTFFRRHVYSPYHRRLRAWLREHPPRSFRAEEGSGAAPAS